MEEAQRLELDEAARRYWADQLRLGPCHGSSASIVAAVSASKRNYTGNSLGCCGVKRPGYHGRGEGCVVDWDFHGGEKLGYGLGRVIIRIDRDAAVRWWFGVDGDKRELAEVRQRSHGCCLRLQVMAE
ncbi:hypothetical protein M0R45_014554 [Rubus argutus]|uniref:Uncharacterized protein n=1 Tax=Rubus argutus TaxID=59490 RepID=A0AAW1XPG5_RUBAR